MKKLAVFLGLLTAIVFCGAETILIDNVKTSVKVLSSNDKGIRLEYRFGSFEAIPVEINGTTYQQLKIPGEPVTYEKGEPELPFFANSIMIPGQTGITVSLVENDAKEYPYMPVPSKGNLLRTVDPDEVPWTFSETYKSDNTYPASLVEAGEPYILREVRGAVIKANPFVFDAKRKMIIVRHRMVVDVHFEGASTINILPSRPDYYTSEFEEIYTHQFLNFEQDRYTTMTESGGILIICHPDFMDAMQPYIEWKQQNGYNTRIVDVTTIGSTPELIKTYIQTEYDLGGLAFVQLVGDAAQIPTFQHLTGGSDPSYSLLAGSDNYPDIYVGRFSATTAEAVALQVTKTIHYERDMEAASWLAKGTGIGSEQGEGAGNEGEADYVHIGAIRTQLLNYGYFEVDEFYGNNGATAAMVTTALNSGRSVLNYCGHGSAGSWGTTGFNIANVNALTNDNKLPFIHAVACVNGDFDTSTCFAETWLRAKNSTTDNPTGAVAFYGSSINQSWASPMEAQDETNSLLVNDSKLTIGGLWYNGSCSMIEDYGTDGSDMFKTWHIFGDASLQARTRSVTFFTVSHANTLTLGQTSFAVDTNEAGARVTLWVNGTILGTGITNSSGDITLTLSPAIASGTFHYLTITAHNKQTYQVTLRPTIAGASIWTGEINTNWHTSYNWSNNMVPGSLSDAIIPGELTNYPVISSENGQCRNLYIDPGAGVTISGYELTVNSNLETNGQLRMNQENSVLGVAGNINWGSGASADITNSATSIYCKGSMTFTAGSNVQMLMGDIQFQDTQNSYILNKSSLTQINNLVSDKISPAFLAFSSESTQPITVNGNIINLQSRTMFNYYPGNIVLKGNLTSHNTNASGGLMWFHGTLVMDGTNQSIALANASSYVNNLTASQTGTLTNTNTLRVKGNLTVETGSSITVGSTTLTVEDNATFYGQLNINSSTGDLYVLGNIIWESGSTAIITNASADIYCQGNMTFASTSNVQMTSGYLEFYGTGESNIENHKSTTQIYNLRSNKTAPGFLAISASSNQSLTINGSIWNYQNRILHNYYSGTVSLKGNLNNYNTNTDGFVWNTGTLNLSGTNQTIALANPADCIVNLILAHSGIVTCNNDFRISGTITLQSGTFSPGAHIVYVGSNWTQNSAATFTNTNSTVVFNGASNQIVNTANFNVMRLNKSGGNLKIQSGSTVVAASYKYDMGTIEVTGGTFTVNDLADNNIKGNYILSAGIINLTQDDTYFVDLDANLNISGGVMNVSGGYNFPVDWACTRNINITMSGGILDWGTNSIGITETGFIATLVLTGGTIRTQGSVSISRPNVYFLGGTFEMYGSPDVNLSLNVAAAFYNLNINKASTREDKSRNERVNHVVLTGNVNIDNDLIVTSGILNLGNYTCDVTNNASFYGTLSMTLTGALLHVSKDITWYTGSTGVITAGVINIERNWTNQNGITMQIGTSNNVNFTGTLSSILSLADSSASFGNITIDKTSNSVYADAGTQYLNVAGNLTVNSSNIFNFRNSISKINGILTVNGTTTLMAGSTLDVYDINLVNTMSITDATVSISHNFTKLSTSNLTINSGSFNIDAPYTGTLFSFAGITNLNGGAFQITNDGILLGTSSYFYHSGGTLKLGWGFSATAAGVFQPTQGAVEFIGSRTATIECSNGNYFHDVIFNKTGTSYQVLFATNVTVNNDMFVQGGNPYLMNHTLTVNRDIVINGGILTASNAADIINVGRNWSNNVDPNAFAQGSGIVNFFSGQTATVSTETFYKVIVSKTSADVNDLILSAGKTMTVNGYLDISSGCLKVEPGSILDTNGTVTIESSGGLDLDSSGSPTTLRVAGNMYDEGDESGIGIGLNADTGTTLIFDGSADQTFGADYISLVINLCNVTVNKAGGKVKPYNNMNFLGNFTVTNGEWSYATSGKTKNFSGDLIVETGGIFSDSTGTSNMLGSTDSNLKILGSAKFGTIILNKTISNNVLLTGNATFAGTTTITLTTGTLNLNSKTLKYKGTMTVGTDGKLYLTGGSILNINDSSTLSIGQYGEFVSLGTNGNPAMLTSDTGYYAFSTLRYSSISADYTIFEKMNTNGINFDTRCIVDSLHCFYKCTFRNAAPGGSLLKIPNNKVLTIVGASFPDNPPISQYNVYLNYALSSATFRSFTGAFAGADYDYNPYGNIVWETPTTPNPPSTVIIDCTLAGAVITWSPVHGATGYIVYRSFIPGTFTQDDILIETDLTTFTDEAVNIYPKAFYMIKAYNE